MTIQIRRRPRHGAVVALLAFTLTFALTATTDQAQAATDVPTPLGQTLFLPDVETRDHTNGGNAEAIAAHDAEGSLHLRQGLELSTGKATSSSGDTNWHGPGDPDLDRLLASAGRPLATTDAAVVELTFIPTTDVVNLRYVFTSDELMGNGRGVGHPDVLGIWLDGVNIAVIGGQPVTAATIAAHSQSFDNRTNRLAGHHRLVSAILTASATVSPHEPHHLKIAVGDAGSGAVDGSVFVEANNVTPILGDRLLLDDFSAGTGLWSEITPGLGVVDLDGNPAFGPTPNLTTVTRSSAGASDWESYVVRMRVTFDQFRGSTSWLTLYARYVDPNNYYLVEMQGHPTNGYLALKRKVDGFVMPLQERNWRPAAGEWIDLELVVSGGLLEFRANGELLLQSVDYGLEKGSLAIGTYRTNLAIDDVTVHAITNPATGRGAGGAPTPVPAGTYYVSPGGSDSNPGTEAQPWKTMAKAAESAQAGTTVIFEDGIYPETRGVAFQHSGTAADPIVFRSRTKHGATIVFQSMPTLKILLRGTSHITLQDFEITQDAPGATTGDILVHVREGADHVRIIGNHIHGAFEDGVKGYLITDLLVRENLIENIGHEAVDFVNVAASEIGHNEAREIGRVGLMVKGGSSDIKVRSNVVSNLTTPMMLGAIYLGGQTDRVSTRDNTLTGFEAYNVVAYNNVVHSGTSSGTALIPKGIVFMGSKNSAAHHNVVAGVAHGIWLERAPNLPIGWAWSPDNVNPSWRNNIVVDSTTVAVHTVHPPVNADHDHNLYHGNAGTAPVEQHGITADPQFVAPATGNWHLAAGSPAIGAGSLVSTFLLEDGVTTIVITDDFTGLTRGTNPALGIHVT